MSVKCIRARICIQNNWFECQSYKALNLPCTTYGPPKRFIQPAKPKISSIEPVCLKKHPLNGYKRILEMAKILFLARLRSELCNPTLDAAEIIE